MVFIIELLLAFMILSMLISGLTHVYDFFRSTTGLYTTKSNLINLDTAFKQSFYDINSTILNNSNCQSGLISCPSTFLPCSLTVSNSSLYFSYTISSTIMPYVKNDLLTLFSSAGCYLVSSQSNLLSFSCQGYIGVSTNALNNDFCSDTNYSSLTYLNPVPIEYPQIYLTALIKNISSNSFPISITYTVDLSNEYSYFQNISLNHFITIANALKNYETQRRITELNNSCTAINPSSYIGGLDSSYDFYVPWVLQICGSLSQINYSCTYSGTDYCPYCQNITFNSCTTSTVLSNLGLSSVYSMDGFSNPLIIYPLYPTLSSQSIPSNTFMLGCQNGNGICPPFHGLIKLANSSLSCVNNNSPYCSYQIVYP